jgi:hypothetical protein
MKLSDNTLTVLKNFSSINHGILFRAGNVIRTISPQKTVMASAEVEETFDRDFAIYDLSKFLGALTLFDRPEIKFGDTQATIASDKRKLVYTYADPSTFLTAPSKELNFPETDIKFNIANEELQKIQKAASVLQLPETVISGDGENIYLSADDSKNPSKDKYSIVVGQTNATFNAVFKNENLKLLPNDYAVEISDKGISKFSATGVVYFIASEATSTFN